MPRTDDAYWKERFTQLEAASHKSASALADEIDDAYKRAQTQIERDLGAWYQRFAVNNQISMQEARRLLNSRELSEFRWTVDEYIKRGKENGVSGQWTKQLENASARFHVTRLQAIQLDLQNTVETLYGNQLDGLDALAKKTYLDTYYHSAFELQRGVGVGWDIAGINQKALAAIIRKPWTTDGRNFSDRIWTNKTALISELQKQLSRNLMLGKSPAESVKILSEKFGVDAYKAGRLIFTETAYFQAVSQGDCFGALGVKKFVFVATLDDRTSDICREMDGEIFDMKDYQPGTNVPPLHPWCRSCTAPYFEDLKGIGERAARDPENGQTYYVPREMKYEDWKQAFVDGGGKTGLNPVPVRVTIESGIKACKTVSEVEDYMKKQGWFNPNHNGDQNQLVSLAGCDLECAQEIASAYEQVFDRYPVMKGRIDAVRAERALRRKRRTYAQCYTMSGGKVEVNPVWFSDHEKLKLNYELDVKMGFHPANTSWGCIVTHEIGHAIDGELTRLGLGGYRNDASLILRTNVMSACGFAVTDTEREVSRYATKNNREWFAECFAESLSSPTPRPVAREFRKQLEEMMKGVK